MSISALIRFLVIAALAVAPGILIAFLVLWWASGWTAAHLWAVSWRYLGACWLLFLLPAGVAFWRAPTPARAPRLRESEMREDEGALDETPPTNPNQPAQVNQPAAPLRRGERLAEPDVQ